MNFRPDGTLVVIAALVCLLVLGIGYVGYRNSPHIGPLERAAAEVTSPSTSEAQPVTVQVPVKTYKPSVKKATRLPVALKEEPEAHLIATTRAERNERPVEVNTVLNEKTGDVTTVVSEVPRPWLSYDPKTEVYAEYGMKFKANVAPHTVTTVGVSHEIIKIKSLTLGVSARADTDREAYAGVRMSMRF